MSQRNTSTAPLRSMALIAAIIGLIAVSFAYVAGWLTPGRLTPGRVVAAFAPPTGVALGHRRNHAKGVCFTGTFESNGAGAALSLASVLAAGRYPAVGRFNLGTAEADAVDAKQRVRGLGLRIATPDGHEWRAAMVDLPFFPVSTPQTFYALLEAQRSKAPDAMKSFAGAHPELAHFGAWAASAPWTGSYAEERYNSLNSFVFTDGAGRDRTVRWSLIPAAQPVAVTPEELATRDRDFLEEEIARRVAGAPQRWNLVVTVANPGDPTADPSQAWPAERRSVDVGTLVVSQIEPERDGVCRDINFDPTVLPPGMRTSDDPFPAARSAVYARSYNLRTAEERYYPRKAPEGTKP